MPAIVRRVEERARVEDLAAVLGNRLSPSDVQALLLEACRRRAARLTPVRLLDYYREHRFVGPSIVDPRIFHAFDRAAYAELPADYVALELSPVCPLGAVAGVTGLSQDWAVSTVRNTEVIADPTNVLALEYAVRRLGQATSRPVKLAASHRALRGQKFESPRARPHFRVFSLCAGGRDTGNLGTEIGALTDQVGFYVRTLRRFLGPDIPLRVAFTETTDGEHRERLEGDLMAPLRSSFPSVRVTWDPQRKAGRGYYRRLCFHIYARHADGRDRELVDGGDVDWAEKLLNHGKERLVISGLGTEGLCREFAPVTL